MIYPCRDNSLYAPSQWETTLHCNAVSNWLDAYTKWLIYPYRSWLIHWLWNNDTNAQEPMKLPLRVRLNQPTLYQNITKNTHEVFKFLWAKVSLTILYIVKKHLMDEEWRNIAYLVLQMLDLDYWNFSCINFTHFNIKSETNYFAALWSPIITLYINEIDIWYSMRPSYHIKMFLMSRG